MPIKRSPIISTKDTFLVTVTGESLWPKLVPGKTYRAAYSSRVPKVGEYVIFKNPTNSDELLVKQVQSVQGNTLIVGGTVSWSAVYTVTHKEVIGIIQL